MEERKTPRDGQARQNQDRSTSEAEIEPPLTTDQLLREILVELRGLKQELHDQRPRIDTTDSALPAVSNTTKVAEKVLEDLKSKKQTLDAPVYRYHWRLPVEPSVDEETKYPEPSEEDQDSWLPYIGSNWQIPNDPFTPFKFHSSYLISQPVKSVAVLREIQQMNQRLEKSGYFKPLVVEDYLDNGETYNYYVHPDQIQASPPKPELELEVRPNWRIDLQSRRHYFRWKSPWRRLIVFTGLGPVLTKDIDLDSALPWIFLGRRLMRFTLRPFIKAHFDCTRLSPFSSTRDEFTILVFHITYFMIEDSVFLVTPGTRRWSSGPLHTIRPGIDDSSGRYERTHLAERAITLIMISDQHKVPPPYWNLFAMLPERTYFRHMMDEERPDTFSAMIIAIKWALENVIDAQTHIQHYFEAQISGENTIFDPEAHDRLLTDDETFSRSKFYFWAINTLRKIDIYMENIIQQVEACFLDWPRLYPMATETEDGKICLSSAVEGELREQINQLQHIKEDFKKLRNEAIALRDGLFSASAVMESRASTRLGENIKLLTYVSIFFLPLSFCMSLWSINEEVFSLHSLSIVATTVSLATYIAVFNVNRLSTAFVYLLNIITNATTIIFRPFLNKTIEAMKKDENVTWQERGQNLNVLFKKKHKRPSEVSEEPSRWRIAQYALQKPWAFLWSKEPTASEKQNGHGLASNAEASNTHSAKVQTTDHRGLLDRLSFGKQRKRTLDVEISEHQA